MQTKHALLLCAGLSLIGYSCGDPATTETTTSDETTVEDVGSEPMATSQDGWTDLLANGSLDAWHRYGGDDIGAAWTVDEDGALYFDPEQKGEDGGDVVTNESYANYELELEWKIAENGNSGIIYNVVESDEYPTAWRTGPEMQVLDNEGHPDAELPSHRAGALYDMIPAEPQNARPAGEWNSVRLVVTDGQVQHYQNGEMVVEYPNTGEEWERMIADSKFAKFEGFGQSTSGKIALQDHGDPVWYRNIRVRPLGDSK